MKVLKLAAGFGIGYVLGSRAGRDKYEQIVAAVRRAQSHPAVAQAQQKAQTLLGSTTETDPVPAYDQPTATTGDPVSRPPRRRAENTPTVTIDPLT